MSAPNEARRFGLSDADLDRASLALQTAVREYLEEKKTGRGRKTAAGFIQVVRAALGRKRCSKDLFELVLQRSVEKGYLVQEVSESGRLYLHATPEPSEAELPEAPKVVTGRPRAAPVLTVAGAGPAPVEDYPPDHRCPACRWDVPLCAHCARPAFDDCLYVDSKGRWRCDSCNDLHANESWGGFLRWNRPHEPEPESEQLDLLEIPSRQESPGPAAGPDPRGDEDQEPGTA
tara:strand:+ start:570 stop:1265 length:696 start_codon:yes stop_codon:yes gene_type:complete